MIIKKIAAISASLILLLSVAAYGSDFYTVYDLSNEVKLSSGITYEKIERYTSLGWMNINVIRADLTDNYTKVQPVNNNNGLSNREQLSSMLQSAGAIAGVNGDFFYMGDPTYSYGAIIRNHNLITSPLPYSYGYPTVSRKTDGTVDISLWNPIITLYGSDNTKFDVVVYNKISSIDWGPTILTSDWNQMSPGYNGTKDTVEVVVVNNTVSEIRKNLPSTVIPKDGFIVASSDAATMEKMVKSFIPGNPITLDIQLDFDLNNIEWSFGALNYLVKNGQTNDISDEALGTHPRTAIGFNEDNTQMILVTIDGRNKSYVGVKQTELANIMVGLGAYNAVNMDGGGSTTMAVDFLKNSNLTVVNIPSDGRQRKLASGVGVFDTAPQSNNISSIDIIPKDDKVFNNTELSLDLICKNEYYSKVELSDQTIKYEVSPSDAGTVVNNIFKPKKPGKVEITANIGNATGKAEIEVLDSPVALKFNSDNIIVGLGETYKLGNILGIDKYGNSASISSNYINYTYRNRIGKVEDGIFTAGDISNTGAISASFGNALKNIQVKIGYRYKTLNRFEDLNGLNLSLYPDDSDGNFEITDAFVKEGQNALKLDYDFTKMTDQSIAFVNFDTDGDGIKLDGYPKAIGMWVYGDGKSHWLRCRITDAHGTQTKLTLEDEVNWTGWKWVTTNIPTAISYPVTLNNIYLAEINETKKDSGTIYIDNLRLMYEPNDKNLRLDNETKFTDLLKTSEIADYSEKLTISPEKRQLIDSSGNNVSDGQIINFDGIITNGTMSASDKTMWNNIKSLADYKDKVLVLSMNTNLNNIIDKREVQVLKKILEEASINNEVYIVYKGDEENTFIENKMRYISYDDSFELGITSNGVKYKN